MEDYPQQNAEIEESTERRAPPKAPPPIIGESENIEINSSHAAEASPDVAVGGTALFGRELLRRRQEVKLRREVARLKKRAQDLQTEQQTVNRQQQEFSKRLEEQEAFQKLKNVTMPKLENSRQKLRGRLEPQTQANQQELNRAIAQAERLADPNVQAEEVLYTVEAAAEQNLPIESAYERRHERKGEESGNVDKDKQANQDVWLETVQLRAGAASSNQTAHVVATNPDEDEESYSHERASAGTGLYRRAIKSGFWAAIVMMVVIILTAILR